MKPKFQKDFECLQPDIKRAAKAIIQELMQDPIPTSLRLHSLRGYKNPKVFTIDVLSNHSYKISLEIDGDTATLRRIATHSIIDRAP